MKKKLYLLGMAALMCALGMLVAVCKDSSSSSGGGGGGGGEDGGIGPGDPALSGTITISPPSGGTTGTQLTATYSGSETVTYQWNKDGSPISGADGGTLQVFTPSETGSYIVTVSVAG